MVLPAYAGMIRPSAGPPPATRGAPRVCGDDPRRCSRPNRPGAVLPAYAGMIRRGSWLGTPRTRAPRVCGDDDADPYSDEALASCSPRMRG